MPSVRWLLELLQKWLYELARLAKEASKEWQIFAINSLFLLNISIFPWWNFFKLSFFVKMILINILRGKKCGVIQTDSPISRDFLFLIIKLNCSNRIFPKHNMWKVALISQNVQNFKKIHQRKRKKIYCFLCFFWLCLRLKISGKTYDFMWAHADYCSWHHQHAHGHKTIGSHLNDDPPE